MMLWIYSVIGNRSYSILRSGIAYKAPKRTPSLMAILIDPT